MKKEEEITRLSKRLPPLSEHRKRLIFLTLDKTKDKWFRDNKGSRRGRFYYSIVTTIEEYQVIRKFVCEYRYYRTKEPVKEVYEVMQTFIDKNCNQYIMAKKVMGLVQYYDQYVMDSELKYRGKLGVLHKYSKFEKRVSVEGEVAVYSVQPWLRKYGYTKSQVGASDTIPVLMSGDTFAEFIAKTKQTHILAYYCSWKGYDTKRIKFLEDHKHIFKICSRHNYVIKDVNLWKDMIEAMDNLKADTHNVKYICPKNMSKMHDYFMLKDFKRIEKEELRKLSKDAESWSERYKKEKNAYFGIVFKQNGLTFRVLQSVEEFLKEGLYMKHCVYKMGYYKMPDMLILSAKDSKGKRVETIRVNLKTFKIEESRGKCNKASYAHEDIVNIVNNNMYRIKEAAKEMSKNAA